MPLPDDFARSDADPVENAGFTPFDFDAIADRLDGIPASKQRDFADALDHIIRWMTALDAYRIAPEKRANIAGRRLFVFAWAVCPSALGNVSLRTLAKYLGTTPARLGEISMRIPREFNFRGARQYGRHSKAA